MRAQRVRISLRPVLSIFNTMESDMKSLTCVYGKHIVWIDFFFNRIQTQMNQFQHFLYFLINAENLLNILMEVIGETMDPVRILHFVYKTANTQHEWSTWKHVEKDDVIWLKMRHKNVDSN